MVNTANTTRAATFSIKRLHDVQKAVRNVARGTIAKIRNIRNVVLGRKLNASTTQADKLMSAYIRGRTTPAAAVLDPDTGHYVFSINDQLE